MTDMYHVPYGVSGQLARRDDDLMSCLVFCLACLVEVGHLPCFRKSCTHDRLDSQAVVWPQGGEIDTFEGVNLQTDNQMSLHTETVRTLNLCSNIFYTCSSGMHPSLAQRDIDAGHQYQLFLPC